ncbi:YbjQ family protein [Mucilaginibacter sp. RB4R14]|uniref:YbjQ family protein n=1 Tax=Mucilaginibacter aurantiaciroseus TaxID=2949308 RepID=UPI0020913D5E|nr:YbjQ family protein [Mucilaginibacter aurantiaciroseus]MCO5937185.1 YbjQ family protein [Mucilaginibacter aurantiaciroseus]
MKKILVTTTETLQGWEIVNYIEPIYSNLMVGANFFSDFGASFTDIFGGRATRYEKSIQLLNEKAVEFLKAKARGLGANCILGLKVDVDEVSGKNMQMFMITAWGTAVVVKNAVNPIQQSNSKEVDKDKINERANIIRLVEGLASDSFKLTLKDLQIIVDTRSAMFKDTLLKKFKKLDSVNFANNDDYKEVLKLYNDYFSTLSVEEAIPLFYNDLLLETESHYLNKVFELIKNNDLVDYNFINQLLDGDLKKRKLALNILQADKPTYNMDDIAALEKTLVHLIKAFPVKITIGLKKGFLSSTEKEVWTCTCGTSNSMELKFCNSCTNDHHGFRSDELQLSQIITLLSNKLEALKVMI